MATKATPVTEAQKDEAGVQAIETQIPGVGPVTTYFKIEKVDDVTGKPEAGIETVRLLIPVEDEEVVDVIGEDGEPEKNADGSAKTETEKFIRYETRELDLGPASLTKLVKALKPFADASREAKAPVSTGGSTAAKSSGPNPELSAWNREAKKWLEENRPGYGIKHNTKGRLKAEYEEEFAKATGKPKPGTLGS
ncbi:hypothetical protein QFZ22_003763 [Streptomyces canus]|uniref:Lsr2 family protein n=1 Tax=Streptomyces canus TaxID=58343 RepID=A0AAW8FG32_9ACTN|nr:Lsr2 family protein [Streptomyces canus]MDQ0907778.1 hypothetical protein [Streptomyces canus]